MQDDRCLYQSAANRFDSDAMWIEYKRRVHPVRVGRAPIRADLYSWGSLMAAGILGSVAVASFFVDHSISGLTSGATKG